MSSVESTGYGIDNITDTVRCEYKVNDLTLCEGTDCKCSDQLVCFLIPSWGNSIYLQNLNYIFT